MNLTITEISDRVLVSECMSGRQEAWIELVKRYRRLIYGATLRFDFDIQDRHDIFQTVCLEALKSLPSLQNAASLRYWILTITVRQCYQLLKHKRANRGMQSDETAALTIEDPRLDTYQTYLAAERAEKVREAMGELPERCRCLLELLFFTEDKTSYSQLGDRFGWSRDSIGCARLRCLDKLRKILEERGF